MFTYIKISRPHSHLHLFNRLNFDNFCVHLPTHQFVVASQPVVFSFSFFFSFFKMKQIVHSAIQHMTKQVHETNYLTGHGRKTPWNSFWLSQTDWPLIPNLYHFIWGKADQVNLFTSMLINVCQSSYSFIYMFFLLRLIIHSEF